VLYWGVVVPFLRRFNIAFILLVCVPGLLVSVVLSRLYISALFSTVAEQTEAVADQIVLNMRNEVDGASILTSALFNDLELRSLANQYSRARDSGERFLASNRLDYKMAGFFNYSNRLGAVNIYMKNGQVYYYQNYPNIRSYEGLDPSVYAQARKEAGKVFILDQLTGPTGNTGEKFMLSVAVCTTPHDYDTEIDAILVRFRIPYLDDLRSRPQSGSAGDVIIYGRDGSVLLTSLPAAAGLSSPQAFGRKGGSTSFRQVRFGGRAWLASSVGVESTGWTVVVLVDQAVILGRITSYQWYLYPALAFLVVLFFLYARFITIEREERERARMKAELAALRFQIDPHFVSNTLNSIRLMARAAKADAIAEMTQSLMRVLADSYSGTGPMTTLEHEIANLSSYVGIMKVRFGETFDVAWRLGDDTKDLLVLRMILQPIMENAILHGISPAGRRGLISITSCIEEAAHLRAARVSEPGLRAVPGQRLIIEAQDDGVGMSQETAESVLAPENGTPVGPNGLQRVGLANVHQRIRLNFGEPFGLAVESVPGSYTRVRFVLPVVRQETAVHA
jgi:two-component system, sensor histidine kinase YesM